MAQTYNSGWREWMGKSTDINGNFVVEGLQEQMKQLDALLASNPDMEKRMQAVVRKVLSKAQSQMRNDIHAGLPHDPRQAYKAVRKAVYRRILGGNINILRKNRASGKTTSYVPTRTLKSGQRGGNRKLRSERTLRMDSYAADDRGFILFWLNSGTQQRNVKGFAQDKHRANVKRGSQGGDVSKYGKLSMVNTGNRGSVSSKNIFASNIISLGNFIDQELTKEFNDLLSNFK